MKYNLSIESFKFSVELSLSSTRAFPKLFKFSFFAFKVIWHIKKIPPMSERNLMDNKLKVDFEAMNAHHLNKLPRFQKKYIFTEQIKVSTSLIYIKKISYSKAEKVK